MNITFYTGSGVSQESGVPTFRDPNGLWETFDAGVVSSVDGWKKKPQEFMDMILQYDFASLTPKVM